MWWPSASAAVVVLAWPRCGELLVTTSSMNSLSRRICGPRSPPTHNDHRDVDLSALSAEKRQKSFNINLLDKLADSRIFRFVLVTGCG